MPTKEEMVSILNSIYEKVNHGIGHVSPPISELAESYLKRQPKAELAAKDMLKNQVLKCTTSGFLTGFGGFITLPVTIPANIGSVLYVQMRMIAATAYMGSFDLQEDQVQTFIYACLAGVSVNAMMKKFGVQFAQKFAQKNMEKIPGKVLTKINQRIGFRFVTKAGKTSMVTLSKIVPVVGAGVGGALDYVETKIIAKRAYKMFIEKDFSVGEELSIDDNDFVVVEEA